MNRAAIRERYLKDKMAVRVGGLAANLARIKSFSDHQAHRDIVAALVDESKYFIEWTTPDPEAELQLQAELVEIQIQLALWQQSWDDIWADPARRASVAEEAGRWSQRLLERSGLLCEEESQ